MVDENDSKIVDDSGATDPPKSDPDYVTKDEIKGMFDGFKDEIKGLLGKPEGSGKPDPDDKGKKDEEAHLSRIAAAEERARKMIEEAAAKVLASKPQESEKKEEKKETEKPPIKPRKFTSILWGSE